MRKFSAFAILTFLLINIWFNFSSWQEVFTPVSSGNVAVGDSTLAEYILENNYQNIIHGNNPFIIKNQLFYPYEINVSMNDPGTSNVIFYIFLRPFLGIHQSMLFIVLINSFLANICMYILLRKLNIHQYAAFLAALSFGFMPIVPYRLLGHYTYTSIYLFPLAFLFIYSFIKEKVIWKKIILSMLTGALLAFVLLLNFYYFLTILIGIVCYSVFFLFSQKWNLFVFYFRNLLFALLALIPFLIILLPWFDAVYKLYKFEGVVKTPGFGGAVVLSADLLGFLTPSEYNPIYNFLILKLGQVSPFFAKYAKFYLSNWEKFVYPGLFVWGSFIFILLKSKKSLGLFWIKIKPHFIIGIFFALLTLGPFLKVFNRWVLTLDEGIQLVFPLPFLLLHFVPGLTTVRAPTRFAPAYLFLAYLVVAYIFHYILTKIPRKKYLPVLAFGLLIFFVDQFYILPKREMAPFPIKAYEILRKEPGNGTVLEIPFTVRDGFQYIGFVHAIGPMYGSFLHNKPIIGGYFARINPSIFNYYSNLPFIGYISRIIDKGNYEPLKEKPKEPVITQFNSSIADGQNEINFLNIQYILLKNDEKYSETISELILRLGFNKIFSDNKYDLYKKNILPQTFDVINFSSKGDGLYLAQGFSIREDGFRWAEGKLAKIFFRENNAQKEKIILDLSSFYNPQVVEFYLNDNFIGKNLVDSNKTKLEINVAGKIKKGINTLIIRFSKQYKPAKIIPGSQDLRDLAVKFYSLKVQ